MLICLKKKIGGSCHISLKKVRVEYRWYHKRICRPIKQRIRGGLWLRVVYLLLIDVRIFTSVLVNWNSGIVHYVWWRKNRLQIIHKSCFWLVQDYLIMNLIGSEGNYIMLFSFNKTTLCWQFELTNLICDDGIFNQ